jgi:hypothetical protein
VFAFKVLVALKIGMTPLIGFEKASLSEIVMKETDTPSALTGLVPTISDFVASAEPAMKLTVPPVLVNGEDMVNVFVSAFVDFNVHVDAPVASVRLQAE